VWEGNSNQSMDIFDVSGRKVASFEVQNGFNQVDLSVFLNSGMYFICYQHEGIYQAQKIMFH
jgi:hypothetical protein